MERYFDVRAWKIFLLILKRGSIAKAAEDTLIEPSNISRIVLSLERSLKVKLFYRESPVRLTEEGKRILPLIEEMVLLHQDILQTCADKKGDCEGVVNIGMPPSFFDRILLKHFLEFNKKYPGIQIVTPDYRKVPPINFEEGKSFYDIIITFGPDELLEKKYQYYLGPCNRYPVASPGYLKSRGVPKSVTELGNHTLLKLQTSIIKTGDYLISTGELDIASKFGETITYTSPISLKKATLLGGGIHHGMPAIYCYQEIAEGELIVLENIWSFSIKDYYLFVNPRSRNFRRVKLVLDFLLNVLQNEFKNCQDALTAKRQSF